MSVSLSTILNGYQSFLANGLPNNGGYIYTYLAGTTTLATTYTSSAGNVANSNPIVLSAGGTPPSEIWLTDGIAYKLVLEDRFSVPIPNGTFDNIVGTGGASSGILGQLATSSGASKVSTTQGGAGSVTMTVEQVERQYVTLQKFGGIGDGIADDTAAVQAAVNYISQPGNPKKLLITNGAAGIYKITAATTITAGGINIEWENANIKLRKTFNGDVFIVRAGVVKFVNPGIDGNAANGFTGGAIRFGPATQFTFDCVIDNPRIFGTKDSCLIFEGPRGAAGLQVTGGSLLTYNPTGTSSGGYPSARVIGPTDAEPSDRRFIGVTSSAQPLIDFTGMWVTKVDGCFTGTFFFKGNPDVTGVTGPYLSNSEVFIDNTYIRDGMTVSGSEIMIDNCLTHGHAPIFTGAYGDPPTGSQTWGWEFTADSRVVNSGPTNTVSAGIVDNSVNGLAVPNQNSSFSYGLVKVNDWTGKVTNPDLGNGTVTTTYDIDYKTINFRVKLTTGTTTTRGSGPWEFGLPYWVSNYTPAQGQWALYREGSGWIYGPCILTTTSAVHRISLAFTGSASSYIDDVSPSTLPAGSILLIDYSYSRG